MDLGGNNAVLKLLSMRFARGFVPCVIPEKFLEMKT